MRTSNWISKLTKHHAEFLKIVRNCGGDSYAEDIVQEMYLRLDRLSSEEKVFTNGKINMGYMYFTLRNMTYTYLNQRNKVTKTQIERLQSSIEARGYFSGNDSGVLDDEDIQQDDETQMEVIEKKLAYERMMVKMWDEINTWDDYDRGLFSVYWETGLSYRAMQKESGIPLQNIFQTINRCKDKIKEKFGEDWEDYKNGDYHLI